MNSNRRRIAIYMNDHCSGFRSITPRNEIVKALGMQDRGFRLICSSMPEIISNSRIRHISIGWNSIITVKVGYYALPININKDNTLEIKVALALMQGLKSRTKKIWDRIHHSEQMIAERAGKQASFA